MASSAPADLQTVVFAGPSAPPEAIRTALPGAFLAPPIQRGDLYKYRLLNFSVFVIIDGVFTNALAVSPREVVDTLRDGAAIIGASSMGALRAADCAPAGTLGYGRIYRLFRRRALSSEDEVAVATFPEPPFAPISLALVDIRFALRTACRNALLSPEQAGRLIKVAVAMRYPDRTWKRIAKGANLTLSSEQINVLESRSIKQDDAIRCCHWVAERMRDGRITASPRLNRTATIGSLFVDRERGWAPLDGEDGDSIREEFARWLWASGKGRHLIPANRFEAVAETGNMEALSLGVELKAPDDETAALLMQFTGHRRSVEATREAGLQATRHDTDSAKAEIVKAHRVGTWEALKRQLEQHPPLQETMDRYLQARSSVLAFKRVALLSTARGSSPVLPIWRRT